MKKLLFSFLLLGSIVWADGVVQMIDTQTGDSTQPIIIGVPSTAQLTAQLATKASVTEVVSPAVLSNMVPAYGVIYLHDGTGTRSIATTTNYFAINNMTAGVVSNVTANSSNLVIGVAGTYNISGQISLTGVAVTTYETAIMVNGTESVIGEGKAYFAENESFSVPVNGLLTLAVGDRIGLGVQGSGTGNITPLQAMIKVVRVSPVSLSTIVEQTISTNMATVPSSAAVYGLRTEYDSRYLITGVLLESNGIYTAYTTVTGAYANAVSGNNILIGKGTFEIGELYISKPSIGWYGQGSELTTLHGRVELSQGSSVSNTFKNLTIYNDNQTINFIDTVVSRNFSTNDAYLTMENVNIIAAATNMTAHVFEVSGNVLYLNKVNIKGLASSHGHLCVLKGVNNAKVIDCSSEGSIWNSLYIKADSRSKGNCSNIVVSGFVGKNVSGGGVMLQSAGTNSVLEAISISGVSLNGGVNGIILDGDILNGSNIIRNVSASVSVNNYQCPILQINSSVLSCDFKVTGSLVKTNAYMLSQVTPAAQNSYTYDIDVCSPSGRASIKNGVCKYGFTAPVFSMGVTSNNVRQVVTTNNNLYILITNGFTMATSYMSSNDPVYLDSGSAAGTYKLLSWGTVTNSDIPVAGAVIGYFFLKCSQGTLATNASFTLSPIRAGKALACLNRNITAGGTTLGAITISGTKMITSGYMSMLETSQSVQLTATVGVNYTSASEVTKLVGLGGYVHKARVILFENNAYLCVFSPVVDNGSWAGTVCEQATVELTMYPENFNVFVETVTGLK